MYRLYLLCLFLIFNPLDILLSQTLLEAENATLIDGAQVYSDDAASNGAAVGYMGGIEFANVTEADVISITYSSPSTGNISIRVNSQEYDLTINSTTPDWSTVDYQVATLEVDVPAGSSIRLYVGSGDVYFNVDYIQLFTQKLEAENAILIDGATVYTDDFASNGAAVGYMGGLEFVNVSEANIISIQYSSPSTGTISVRVNAGEYDLTINSTTADWSTVDYQTATLTAPVPAGSTIRLYVGSGDVYFNVDYIELQNAQLSLKVIAEQKGIYIGNIAKLGFVNDVNFHGGNYLYTLNGHFNTLTAENDMKSLYIIPNEPPDPFNISANDLNTSRIDDFIDKANAAGIKRVRGHTMIWHSQAPPWLKNKAENWTACEVRSFSKSYITALGNYCRGKIHEWDVINEALGADWNSTGFRFSCDSCNNCGDCNNNKPWYYNVTQEAGDDNENMYNYIKDCFYWARAADPDAALFYNDFSVALTNPKSNTMFDMAKRLKNEGAPIDGVGIQSHFGPGYYNASALQTNIRRYGAEGIKVHVTEVDFKSSNANLDNNIIENFYKSIVTTSLNEPNCTLIAFWGLREADSWLNNSEPPDNNPHSLWHGTGDTYWWRNPGAWKGVYDGLASLPNNTFPPSQLANVNPGIGGPIGCPGCTIGAICNDGNDCTENDTYDVGCNCIGSFQDSDNDGTCDSQDQCPSDPLKVSPGICGCGEAEIDNNNDGICDTEENCQNSLTISSTISGNKLYKSINTIESDALILAGANVDFTAGSEIALNSNFEISYNAIFHAYILGCPN